MKSNIESNRHFMIFMMSLVFLKFHKYNDQKWHMKTKAKEKNNNKRKRIHKIFKVRRKRN